MTLIGLVRMAAPNGDAVRAEGLREPTLKVLLRGANMSRWRFDAGRRWQTGQLPCRSFRFPLLPMRSRQAS
jgi:hypothetical protein